LGASSEIPTSWSLSVDRASGPEKIRKWCTVALRRSLVCLELNRTVGLTVYIPSYRYNSSSTQLPLTDLGWYKVKGRATPFHAMTAYGEMQV
jgi:hypothetical protein